MLFSSGQRLVVGILLAGLFTGSGLLGYRVIEEYPDFSLLPVRESVSGEPVQPIEVLIPEEPIVPQLLIETGRTPIEKIREPEKNKGQNVLRININTASLAEFQKLPYIGAAKAKNIIEYRQECPFGTIENIMDVPRIGEGTFERIKDYIVVSDLDLEEYKSPEREKNRTPKEQEKVDIVQIDTDGDGIPDTWISKLQETNRRPE
jgi:competence ComEA-like helix-hairpin-helix protein